MTILRLSWMRDEECVITVYATDDAHRKAAVAYFLIRPFTMWSGMSLKSGREWKANEIQHHRH